MTTALHILAVGLSILLVLAVLANKATGAGLSDMFGGGSNINSSASAVTNIVRYTAAIAAVWFAVMIAEGILST